MRTRLFRAAQFCYGMFCIISWTLAYGYFAGIHVSNGYWAGTSPSQMVMASYIVLVSFFGVSGILMNKWVLADPERLAPYGSAAGMALVIQLTSQGRPGSLLGVAVLLVMFLSLASAIHLIFHALIDTPEEKLWRYFNR